MRTAYTELLRCVLMFGICLLHTEAFGAGHMGFNWSMDWCVVAFVFISGYYRCRFSLWKVLKLEGLGGFAALLSTLANYPRTSYAAFWSVFDGYWFLHAYVAMMLFAPMVNAALESLRGDWRKLLSVSLPLMAFCYVWSFGYSFRALRCVVPGTLGLGAYGGFTLLAAYVGARLYRLLEVERFLTVKRALICFFALLPIAAIRFGAYDSILALVMSACAFYLFSRMRIPHWLGNCAMLVAPSTFSIYLLHTNPFVFRRMAGWCQSISDVVHIAPWASAIVLAGLIFASCLCIDLIRRGLLRLCCSIR